MKRMSTDGDLDALAQQLDAANTRMLDGDWSSWRKLLSNREDVAVLGAYGSYVNGRRPVSDRFERTALGYAGGGGQSTHEQISCWTAADLACTVTLERHQTRLHGSTDIVTFQYRATHLFRREQDEWRVVLRHADPLATFVGPEVTHAIALGTRNRPEERA